MDDGSPPTQAQTMNASTQRVPTIGLTAYGCGPREAALFREMAPRFGIAATVTESAVCDATAALAGGNRCISVTHKSPITKSTLLALGRAGVRYISTRSIGYNHIDLQYAEASAYAWRMSPIHPAAWPTTP